jgi:hypothetical protein
MADVQPITPYAWLDRVEIGAHKEGGVDGTQIRGRGHVG